MGSIPVGVTKRKASTFVGAFLKEYGKKRLVIYRESDSNNLQFGLNKDYVKQGENVVSLKAIEEL